MQTYTIHLTLTAKDDIRDIYHYITYELLEPVTANNYRKGIMAAIYKLANYGGSVAASQQEYVQKRYGPSARTVNYKKMTIIYNIIDNQIIIQRLIAGSLIR